MHAVAAMRHHIQNELQTAVQTSSLKLYYQPIVGADNAAVVGAEALLRWTDGEGHVHAPADFISIAEDTGAIIPIGMWVVEQAARQVMQWNRGGMPISVSVNISPRQLEHPDFAESLSRVLRESGVEPSLLEVEITESVLVPNAGSIMRVLEHIKRMGVRIAVDDFGTGYSAFSYLKQLPLDTVKIDRTFVDGIERDVDRAIAESIIAIAHKLGLRVTAEGVETIFQRKILAELGCDRLQGFQICRPVPMEHFEEFARLRLAAS
jgi:EAL domain-containing protein (putative c-di-GMP-specific phosphodiesterase class I)